MKQDNWFICLSYPDFDILIPKEDVLSSNYFTSDFATGKTIVDFDILVHSDLPMSKNKTQLELKSRDEIILQTSIIPDLISASLQDFTLFGDQFGKALLTRGFIAVRFLERKIQYLTDINKIISKNVLL